MPARSCEVAYRLPLSGLGSLNGEGRNAQSSARIIQAITPKKATRRTKRKSFHGPQEIEDLLSGEDIIIARLLELCCPMFCEKEWRKLMMRRRCGAVLCKWACWRRLLNSPLEKLFLGTVGTEGSTNSHESTENEESLYSKSQQGVHSAAQGFLSETTIQSTSEL